MSRRQRGRWLDRYETCSRKQAYLTEMAADDAAVGHANRPCGKCYDGGVMKSYKCPIADHYHIGHRDAWDDSRREMVG